MPYPWLIGEKLKAVDLNNAIGQAMESGGSSVGTAATLPLYSSTKTGIMVPFYLYPNNPYSDTQSQRLIEQINRHHDVPVIVIINQPGRTGFGGPGVMVGGVLVADGNITALIRLCKAAGAICVGYVSTQYAARAASEVQLDVTLWNQLYPTAPLDGIFFDEMPWDPGAGNASVTLYANYYTYCYTNGYKLVIGNPGTNERGEWYATRTADIIVTWENSMWPSGADMKGNFVGGHADYDYRFNAVLVHSTPAWDATAFAAIKPYIKWIYATDDLFSGGAANPWDTLSGYLETIFTACDA